MDQERKAATPPSSVADAAPRPASSPLADTGGGASGPPRMPGQSPLKFSRLCRAGRVLGLCMLACVLALSVDHNDTGEEIYIARFMPRAKVTGYAAQSYQGGDAAVTWGVTFTSEKDTTLGYSEAYIFGGPGWLNLLADMGITQAP